MSDFYHTRTKYYGNYTVIVELSLEASRICSQQVYAIVNTVFNYALLMLTARGSAMLAFVALKLTVRL